MSWLGALGKRYSVAANPLRSQRKIELVVVVLALLLLLQLLYSSARLVLAATPAAVAPAMDALQVKPIVGLAEVSPQASQEIRDRPLFWKVRRSLGTFAIAGDTALDKQQAGQLKNVKLLGVFGGGDTAGIIALVKDKKQRILLGETVQGWTLEAVESNRVVLVDGAQREELVLLPGKVITVEETAAGDSRAPGAKNEARKKKAAARREARAKAPTAAAGQDPGAGRRIYLGGREPVKATTGERSQ